jgi:hypothetical protein
MAHRYDVSLKALFLHEGDGMIRRMLFGTRVVEHLAMEQPQVFNHRADMVVRTEDGLLHQVEFQVSNEAGFGLRMLEYYSYLVRVHGQHVVQTVLYLGREPMRLEKGYQSPSIDFRFEILNLREFDAEALLASDDWADNALALLARGEPKAAIDRLMLRLRGMQSDEQGWAAGTLLLLSGILGLEETVGTRLKEVGMINVMENKVLGPMLHREYEKGVEAGREAGRESVLLDLLAEKFGTLPQWVVERVHGAKPEQVHAWTRNVLRSESLEDTLQ